MFVVSVRWTAFFVIIFNVAMLLVDAAQRGSLNAVLNAIYRTGATLGGMASAWLYARRPDFAANAAIACALLVTSGVMLWGITRIKAPVEGLPQMGREKEKGPVSPAPFRRSVTP